MAITFDNAVTYGHSTSTGAQTLGYSPVGVVKGIFLLFVGSTDINPQSVQYGGVNMTSLGGTSMADGEVHSFYLGSGIPTGAQNFSWTNASGSVRAAGIGVTATGDTELAGVGVVTNNASGGTQDDPSVTITGIAGASYGVLAFVSGENTAGSISMGSGMTQIGTTADVGPWCSGFARLTTEKASGDLTMGIVTSNSETIAMVGIAIQEKVSSFIPKIMMS